MKIIPRTEPKNYIDVITQPEASPPTKVYRDLTGKLRPLPFDTDIDGIWRYDGQFIFYRS